MWLLQMENLFESTVISLILFNPFAKNTSCVVIIILTCTELKGHCFVLVSGYVC